MRSIPRLRIFDQERGGTSQSDVRPGGNISHHRVTTSAMAITRPPGGGRKLASSKHEDENGFTLVELLVVMGIIVLLLGLTVPAVMGLSRSGNLNNAGRLVSNLLTVARSEAINQRTYVRVEIMTQTSDFPTLNYRKLTLTRLILPPPTGTIVTDPYYQQFTGWETLPEGVIFQPTDPSAGSNNTTPRSYWLETGQVSNADSTPDALAFGGKSITSSAKTYLTFTPTGAVRYDGPNPTQPIWMRLVEGSLSGGSGTTINYTNRGTNGVRNYFDVAVNSLTGRMQIGRPEQPLD